MPRLSVLVVFLCMPPMLKSAPQPSPFTREQKEVIQAHNTIREAVRKRDFSAWSPYVAEDCIFSDEDGELITKAKLIEHLRNLPLVYDHSENQRDMVVHMYGNTAVLNFRATSHEQFSNTDIVTEMRETETFIKRNGLWKLIAQHWGSLPVNFRKAAPAEPGIFKDYVGRYEWRPLGPVDQVSVRDGRLWSRLNDEPDDHEYLPWGEETFFIKDDLGSVTFVRDPQGTVIGYTYHRVDGQEIHVRKIQ